MRKIILTALAIAPLFGGVALAAGGNSHAGDGMPTQLGPEAYPPSALAQWRQRQDEQNALARQFQQPYAAQQTAPTTQTD